MTTNMELASDVRLNYPPDVTLPEFVLQRAVQFDSRPALVSNQIKANALIGRVSVVSMSQRKKETESENETNKSRDDALNSLQ